MTSALEAESRRIAEECLRAANQCRDLRDGLGQQDIDVLFLKGLATGKLAFGNAILKRSRDVDILVAEADVEGAATVLRRLGYECSVPSLRRWHRIHKESTWVGAVGVPVELHSRLADNPSLIAGIGLKSARQTVEVVPGVMLDTLAGDDLLAYLAVHGASSAWFRLKWITEFSALSRWRSDGEISEVFQRLRQVGADRAFGQALLLSNELFGTSIPAGLTDDGGVCRLARIAQAQAQEEREPTARPFGTATIHLSQLLLSRAPAFPLAEAGRQLREIFHRRFRS